MTDVTAALHPGIDALRRHESLLPSMAGLTFLGLLVLTLFALFPALDIAVSRQFFEPAACPAGVPALSCGDFPARADPLLRALREILQALAFLTALALGIWVAARLALAGKLGTPLARAVATAFWTYAIAVGLVVNAGLKSYSGRPRPINTELFGGDLPFVPAGKITSYCASNCSFVSGETASAAWLLCLAPLLPPAWRMAGLAAAAGLLVLTGAMRLAFGAHYLSDVLIAVAVTLLAHRLLTMAAVRIHRARPQFGQETSAAAIAEGRAWLKQAREWPRRRESWR